MHEVIKKLSGNVVGFGLDKTLSDKIEKNSKITECTLLDSYTKKTLGKWFRKKTLHIKKIRKHFKKKKVDYIICNYEVIYKFLNTFVMDSIYINKNKIYFYNVDDYETLEKRYKRYNTVITRKKDYLEIDNSKAKTKPFKDIYYRLYDTINKCIEVIGDVLMN